MRYRHQRSFVFCLCISVFILLAKLNDQKTRDAARSAQHQHAAAAINSASSTSHLESANLSSASEIVPCVAILTGHPRSNRRRYVSRLVANVVRDVRSVAGRQLHVFCDGAVCGGGLEEDVVALTRHSALRVHFHALRNVSRVESLGSSRASMAADGRLFDRYRGFNETVRLSGVEFQRHRWLFVARNYRHMFDDLFVAGDSRPDACVILEDDLLLADDSLDLLDAVHRLMRLDPTVFTGSVFADNSFPLYAVDAASFHRVSHFAGLGFIMTRRWYVGELRGTWGGLQNWDEVVQRFVARRHLSSVVPELSRALHLRRLEASAAETVTCRMNSPARRLHPAPRHPFESQLLSHTTHHQRIAYDRLIINDLHSSVYTQHLVDVIDSANYIGHLEDALFYGPQTANQTVVYWRCAGDRDLDDLLTGRGLWGRGNGGVVRGSYRGTLLLRYFYVQVLIVCENSEFHKLRVVDKPEVNFDAFLPTYRRDQQPEIARRFVGVVHRLSSDFRFTIGRRGQSCDDACAQLDRKCDVTGLWLLNESCDVMAHFVSGGCRSCRRMAFEGGYEDGVLPAVPVADEAARDADDQGADCLAAYPHFISCQTASLRHRRLCVCCAS